MYFLQLCFFLCIWTYVSNIELLLLLLLLYRPHQNKVGTPYAHPIFVPQVALVYTEASIV